jgi:hypothetical protein
MLSDEGRSRSWLHWRWQVAPRHVRIRMPEWPARLSSARWPAAAPSALGSASARGTEPLGRRGRRRCRPRRPDRLLPQQLLFLRAATRGPLASGSATSSAALAAPRRLSRSVQRRNPSGEGACMSIAPARNVTRRRRERSVDFAPVQPIPARKVEGARSPAQADRRDPLEDIAEPFRGFRLAVGASDVPTSVVGSPRTPFGQDVERIWTSLERERAERRREIVVRMTAQRFAPVDEHRAIADEADVVAAHVAVHERRARPGVRSSRPRGVRRSPHGTRPRSTGRARGTARPRAQSTATAAGNRSPQPGATRAASRPRLRGASRRAERTDPTSR